MIRQVLARRPRRFIPRTDILLIAALVSATASHAETQVAAPARTPESIVRAAGSEPGPEALKDFEARLDGYLELRQLLAKRLKPLSPTPNAADLAARQESLAAAIREARERARPGDLLTPPIARQIRALVAADLRERKASEKRGTFEEVPVGAAPVVNKVYPAGAALATVPPLLLNAMPKLPDNLQYRFYDRHVILLDGDTNLVIDFVLNALPPLAKNDPDHH